jgi:hypothetical protein
MWQYDDDAAHTELAYRHEQAQDFIARQRRADLARCCRVAVSLWRRLIAPLRRPAQPGCLQCG